MTDPLSPTRRELSEWARLTQKKFRRERGQFLVEGTVCVLEALRSRVPIEAALVLKSEFDSWRARKELSRIPLYALNTESFSRFSKVESSQGILAVARTFSLPARESILCIACEQVSDPGNCGALIRVADFFGAGELFLGQDSAEIWIGKVVRGSMGSLFHQPVRADCDLQNVIREWKGVSVALVSHGGEPLTKSMNLKPPTLLVLGHETRGLSDELAALCTHRLTLEPRGPAESLNLVTAAAVAAFAMS
ncbi:MAG: RNA methyltransferase [bacterium]|nr:RNA methyltransferase [bacterium]